MLLQPLHSQMLLHVLRKQKLKKFVLRLVRNAAKLVQIRKLELVARARRTVIRRLVVLRTAIRKVVLRMEKRRLVVLRMPIRRVVLRMETRNLAQRLVLRAKKKLQQIAKKQKVLRELKPKRLECLSNPLRT